MTSTPPDTLSVEELDLLLEVNQAEDTIFVTKSPIFARLIAAARKGIEQPCEICGKPHGRDKGEECEGHASPPAAHPCPDCDGGGLILVACPTCKSTGNRLTPSPIDSDPTDEEFKSWFGPDTKQPPDSGEDAEGLAAYLEKCTTELDGVTINPRFRNAAAALRRLSQEKDDLARQLSATICDMNIDDRMEKLAIRFGVGVKGATNDLCLEALIKEMKQEILHVFCDIALPYRNAASELTADRDRLQSVVAETVGWLEGGSLSKHDPLYDRLCEVLAGETA